MSISARMRRIFLLAFLTVLFCSFSQIQSYADVLPTDRETPSSGNVLIAFPGYYYPDSKETILNEINRIRYEACREGLRDPSNPSQRLSLSDYRPIKWSYDMEENARIRAAESALGSYNLGHTRPNDTSWFTLRSTDGVSSNAESLAWNYGGLMEGIQQWYGEKQDYIRDSADGNIDNLPAVGHYMHLISPKYTHTAVAAFWFSNRQWIGVAQESCRSDTSMNENKIGNTGYQTQIIEVSKDFLELRPNSWFKFMNKWYYTDSSRDFVTGYVNVNGKTYFFDKYGVMRTGWIQDGDTWYYLNSDGSTRTGWIKTAYAWYYLGSDGAMKTGWVKSGWAWYYMDNSGAMRTDWIQDGDNWYYLNSDGSMRTGWIKTAYAWYYLGGDGAMKTGWVKSGWAWYYMDNSGAMRTGWIQDGDNWYYLNSDGSMRTGWIKTAYAWYYLGGDGAMKTGWIKSGSHWYYLNSDGSMRTADLTEGDTVYRFNASGAMI